MNLQHAAALALVGLYLMTATVENVGSFTSVKKKAPLSDGTEKNSSITKSIARRRSQNTSRILRFLCAKSRTYSSLSASRPL